MTQRAWKYIPIFVLFTALFLNPLATPPVQGNQDRAPISGNVQPQTVPACKNRINIPDSELHWLYVPQSAAELHTELPYVFLAGQLIQKGAVDATSCPAGGLTADGSANACGLARTKSLVIEMQNAYDEAIMKAWTDYGVPPVVMKQLIRYESQFWPGRSGEYHYGLGHVTFYGAHTALTRRPDLLSQVSSQTGTSSTDLNSPNFDAFLNLMDAYCPTCQNKIDMPKAQASVGLIAQVVYSYCEQSSQLVFNATGLVSTAIIDYPTLWKIALLNYNGGASCVFETVAGAFKHTQTKVTWYDIETYAVTDQCIRGVAYSNRITEKFFNFPPP